MADRVILHCDLNSFFASVELLEHPELKNLPTAVCGDPDSRHGIILAKNEAAKAFGIQTAETIWQARSKCPQLHLLPAHHSKYHAFSRRINEIYSRYTDLVEPFSVDESWLDVTGSLHLFHMDGPALADHLRAEVERETGLTISVGVSFNKVFAKLGSDYRKPNATTVITRENFRQILWPLPTSDMLFVGRAAKRVLSSYGIHTIGDIAHTDRDALVVMMGKQGGQLWDYANGLDAHRVIPAGEMPPPKSVGNSITFPKNLTGQREVTTGLELLCDSVATRLRRHQMKGTSLQLGIRDPNFHTITRQMSLPLPTNLSRELTRSSMELLRRSWDLRLPIRMLSVTAQGLVMEWEAGEQLDLFASDSSLKREKLERLERTVDRLRGKYGKNTITLGSLSNTPLKGGKEP